MSETHIPVQAIKGRGTATRHPHRFESDQRHDFDDGWSTLEECVEESAVPKTEVIWENARSIITSNDSPDVYFDRSINPYRGCEHGCVYCLDGETRILMADGSTKALSELRVGEEIMGTHRQGHYRRYVRTAVLAHCRTRKPAYRIELADGTSLIASGDHRFLTERGWKFVVRAEPGLQRPYLTFGNSLMGFGKVEPPRPAMMEFSRASLGTLGFDFVHDVPGRGTNKPVQSLRVRGGLREHLRFFDTCDPAIGRKRDISGYAVKSAADLRVMSIEPLEGDRDLFDITTGTGDFVANGVISHNCYARPTHSYLNLSPGLDFETKIIAKRNIAALLRSELAKKSYEPRLIAIGTATDAYQPVERELRLMRSVIELMHETNHPFGITTKSSGVERDLDLIAPMAHRKLAAVSITITTLDSDLARKLEPRAAAPHRRLRTVKTLAEAGVPVAVSLAPQIPFLNDDMEQVLEAAWEAGARSAFYHVIRLPWEVAPLFRQWLELHYPQRAARVMARIHDMRGGKDYDSDFATRMKGTGLWAELVGQRFEKATRRIGFNRERIVLDTKQFRRPDAEGQKELF
jgi:DNA repair photolyase